MQSLRNRWVKSGLRFCPPAMRRLPRLRIYFAPLFKYSSWGGETCVVYVIVNYGVRWVGGLTRGFAGVFWGDFGDLFLGVWNEADGLALARGGGTKWKRTR